MLVVSTGDHCWGFKPAVLLPILVYGSPRDRIHNHKCQPTDGHWSLAVGVFKLAWIPP